MKKVILILVLLIISVQGYTQVISINGYEKIYRNLVAYNPYWVAYELVYPVNHGSMEGYIDANPFQRFHSRIKARHLGVDITSPVPGDEDLGDTIYSIGRGIVVTQWSNCIMIMHKTRNGFIVSQYRHCMEIFVVEGQYIDIAQPIARIGNEWGLYQAHLHFEIRTDINLDVEGGYGNPTGYVDPLRYIESYNRYWNIPIRVSLTVKKD